MFDRKLRFTIMFDFDLRSIISQVLCNRAQVMLKYIHNPTVIKM